MEHRPRNGNLSGRVTAPLVMCLLAIPCWAVDLTEARQAKTQFESELKAALDAQAQNDTKGLSEHGTKAQELLKEARRLYDAGGAARSDDVQVLREYADLLSRMGDSDLAAEALQRAVARTPDDAVLWRELGRNLGTLGHGRAADAVRALRRSLDLDDASSAAGTTFSALGRVYRQEGLYEFARESYTKAVALDPDYVPARMGLIGAKLQDGQVREASDELDALGTLPLEYAPQMQPLLAESLERFEQARRWFPDAPENHVAYAKILLRLGRLQDALDAAERAVKLAPGDFKTWNLIGDLSRQLNDPAHAREAYTRSLELKADQPRTQESLKELDKPAGK